MVNSSTAEVFISYSYKDEELFKQLEKYLTVLAQNGKIRIWHGRKIPPGDEWKKVIDDHIKSADLVLLLVSVDFLVSDYCINVEFESALKRHAIGATRIIPIILHPCPWPDTAIGRFEVLPKDGEPIARSNSTDTAKAFLSVTNSIRELIESNVVRNHFKRITLTVQTSENNFNVEEFTVSLHDDVGANLDRIAISVESGGNKVIIEGDDQVLHRIVNALHDPAFRRQITGGVGLKSITYIEDDYLRYIPLGPTRPVPLKYALLLAAIVVVVITGKSFFVSWSPPQEDYIHSPTPTPSATSLPTPTVMPSPTQTIQTGVQITITEVPASDPEGGRNSNGHIAGKVSGLKTRDYYVVIYAFTGTWYVQPTTDNPRTEIKPDGRWEADIQLGSRYAALVVPPNFNAPYQITSQPTQLHGIAAATEVEGSSQITGEAK